MKLYQVSRNGFSLSAIIAIWNVDRGVCIWLTEGDATTSEVIRSELDRDSISGDQTYPIFLHFSSHIRTNHHV